MQSNVIYNTQCRCYVTYTLPLYTHWLHTNRLLTQQGAVNKPPCFDPVNFPFLLSSSLPPSLPLALYQEILVWSKKEKEERKTASSTHFDLCSYSGPLPFLLYLAATKSPCYSLPTDFYIFPHSFLPQTLSPLPAPSRPFLFLQELVDFKSSFDSFSVRVSGWCVDDCSVIICGCSELTGSEQATPRCHHDKSASLPNFFSQCTDLPSSFLLLSSNRIKIIHPTWTGSHWECWTHICVALIIGFSSQRASGSAQQEEGCDGDNNCGETELTGGFKVDEQQEWQEMSETSIDGLKGLSVFSSIVVLWTAHGKKFCELISDVTTVRSG